MCRSARSAPRVRLCARGLRPPSPHPPEPDRQRCCRAPTRASRPRRRRTTNACLPTASRRAPLAAGLTVLIAAGAAPAGAAPTTPRPLRAPLAGHALGRAPAPRRGPPPRRARAPSGSRAAWSACAASASRAREASGLRRMSLGDLRREQRALRRQARRLRRAAHAAATAPAGPGRPAGDRAVRVGRQPAAVGGGGAFRGKYQFDYGTWASVGGSGRPGRGARGRAGPPRRGAVRAGRGVALAGLRPVAGAAAARCAGAARDMVPPCPITRVEALREQFPVFEQIAYLNAGTCGPLPAQALRSRRRQRAARRPSTAAARRTSRRCGGQAGPARALRRRAGRRAADVALTTATSEGMVRVLAGLGLRRRRRGAHRARRAPRPARPARLRAAHARHRGPHRAARGRSPRPSTPRGRSSSRART